MYINTFKYTPKDVSCQLCTEYVKKLGCTALRCPWLAERIEAGVVGYRKAVMETFPRDRRLSSRLNLLIKHYPGSLWSNEQHERRMQYQCAAQGYDASFGWGLYDFIQSEDDDLVRLEIAQRARLGLQKREVIVPESIEIDVGFSDDTFRLRCSFQFADEEEPRELNVVISAVGVEVITT